MLSNLNVDLIRSVDAGLKLNLILSYLADNGVSNIEYTIGEVHNDYFTISLSSEKFTFNVNFLPVFDNPDSFVTWVKDRIQVFNIRKMILTNIPTTEKEFSLAFNQQLNLFNKYYSFIMKHPSLEDNNKMNKELMESIKLKPSPFLWNTGRVKLYKKKD